MQVALKLRVKPQADHLPGWHGQLEVVHRLLVTQPSPSEPLGPSGFAGELQYLSVPAGLSQAFLQLQAHIPKLP